MMGHATSASPPAYNKAPLLASNRSPPPAPQITDAGGMSSWTSEQVAGWVARLPDGLGQYWPLFLDGEVTGHLMFRLSTTDMESMGITIIGHRLSLQRKLEELVSTRNQLEEQRVLLTWREDVHCCRGCICPGMCCVCCPCCDTRDFSLTQRALSVKSATCFTANEEHYDLTTLTDITRQSVCCCHSYITLHNRGGGGDGGTESFHMCCGGSQVFDALFHTWQSMKSGCMDGSHAIMAR